MQSYAPTKIHVKKLPGARHLDSLSCAMALNWKSLGLQRVTKGGDVRSCFVYLRHGACSLRSLDDGIWEVQNLSKMHGFARFRALNPEY